MKKEEYKPLRKSLGLSQSDLAKELGECRAIINKRENGKATITNSSALALKYLQISKNKES